MVVLLLAWLAAGCTSHKPDAPASAQNEHSLPDEVTLTPIDPFKGEGAKFKPFLGPMTGAFILRYEGNKPDVELDLDLWQHGKKVSASGSIGDLFLHRGERDNREVEVILSVQTAAVPGKDDLNTVKVSVSGDGGSGLYTFTLPSDPKLTARGLIQNMNPVTLSMDKPAYVWGMQATSSNSIRTADFSPESMSGLEWALIVSLRMNG